MNDEQNLKIEQLKLVEGNNFHLNLSQNVTDIEGYVLCQCKVKIMLSKKDGKVIMSNFYRHRRDSKSKRRGRIRPQIGPLTFVKNFPSRNDI